MVGVVGMMIFYLVGMCWMGCVDDECVVVDSWLCVCGIVGLWIVDVLVMLFIILGNINLLMLMIVECVSDMICVDCCVVCEVMVV